MASLTYPRLISHRGANRLAPENTLAAFRLAAEQGAQWLEFDVCLSKDGVPVVFHDHSLIRLTGEDSLVSDHSAQALQAIELLGHPSARIPTLAQVLKLCQQYQLTCNIELKPHTGEEAVPLAQAVAEQLQHYPGPCVVSSFSHISLLHFKVHSHHPIAALAPYIPDAWRSILAELAPVAVHLDNDIASWSVVRQLRTLNLPIAVWTVNDPERYQQLLSFGVTSVFTDDISAMPVGSARVLTGA